MKKIVSVIKKVTLHLNILSLLIFFACGSDNPVNNGNPPPTPSNDSLVKSVDSLAIYGTGINTNDTTLYNIFAINDSVKVTFSVETDCTNLDTAIAGGGCGNISFSVNNSSMPNSFTYYGLYVNFGTNFIVYLKSTSPRYLKMKNIKLYRVNPV